MAETDAVKLARVQTAIAAIESGAQSITIDGRTFNRPDLRILYVQEQRLLNKIDQADRGRITVAEF